MGRKASTTTKKTAVAGKLEDSHIVDIHIRPDFEKILDHPKTLETFKEFAQNQHVFESLSCLLDIKAYKGLVYEAFQQQIETMDVFNDYSGFSRRSSVSSNMTSVSSNVDNIRNNDDGPIASFNSFNSNASGKRSSSRPTSTDTTITDETKLFRKQEKIFHSLKEIIKTYFDVGTNMEVNIDYQSKKDILDLKNCTLEEFLDGYNIFYKATLLDRVELQLLLLLRVDVLPRFSQSQLWQSFVMKEGDIATSCCYQEDIEKMDSLKYSKADFTREYVSRKDLEFSEMVCGDISSLKHMIGSNDLSVFFSKGNQFVRQSEIGVGAFNMSKAVGFLPFPADVVIAAECSPIAMKKFLPTTIFDVDEFGNDVPFLSECTETNRETGQFASYITKFSVDFGPIFTKRTSYAAGTTIFHNGKYFFINKAINNREKYKRSLTLLKKNKLIEKKTENSLVISIHVITPISVDKCHFVHLAVLNVGGLLNPLAGKLYKQTVGKVCAQQQMTTITELNNMKENNFDILKSGFERARKYLDLSKQIIDDEKHPCPFPKSFEEFQQLYRKKTEE